ncbi:hypothetical protein CYMTET_15285 [Cymbomonas tetramitiformis]|uniref:Uncharacterized protein n=1 Tax=Cymbomonas tetramitiformis TaxID=36881 RepID=A0AAE0L928_9CHLO|nr:hypothetical protein CYMTET_15285 [Cymbomonas tetramitiformis]|eukprot:gene9667-11458_t
MIDTSTDQIVFSEPLKELTGGGGNDKYVKECTELYLGDKGIEKLKGFDRLVNLEVLFLSNNKLTHISHLDQNFRMRRLYAANNKIFTLKGPSMQNMRFLELLDLTNNNLRDLQKVLGNIEHLKFLKELELSGNPCCEEPDYRLHTVFRFPSLHVLDSHIVTEEERFKAAKLLGEETVQNNIAFMQKAPPKPHRVAPGQESQLESELNVAVEKLKQRQAKTHISEEQAVVNALEAMHGGASTGRALTPFPRVPGGLHGGASSGSVLHLLVQGF